MMSAYVQKAKSARCCRSSPPLAFPRELLNGNLFDILLKRRELLD